jgi:serine/threonine-protein kinase
MSSETSARFRLGRYEMMSRLAVGGMAEIFLAREVGPAGLERPVVIKRILPHLAADSEFTNLFLQEARLVARLVHPNIVQIHELGEADGTWYIAMEYVSGVTVSQLLRAARHCKELPPVEVALAIVLQACEGAHAAHELADPEGRSLELVHRDITPQNLMVTDDGHVKLLDFGIAKSTAQSEATRTGGVKGKTAYLSPEQSRQEPLDRRSDVFALGIVLWELLAVRQLFRRANDLDTLNAIAQAEVPDLRESRPEVPGPLVEALVIALARDREARYPTADAMRRSLEAVAREHGLFASHDTVATFVVKVLGSRRREDRAAVERVLRGGPSEPSLPDGVRKRMVGGEEWSTSSRQTRRSSPSHPRSRARLAVIAALSALLAAGGLAVWLRARGPGAPVTSGPTLVLGLVPAGDPKVTREEHEPLRTYLERRTGRPFEIVVAKSYDDLAQQIAEQRVHLAALPGFLFLRVQEREPRLFPLATLLTKGSAGNNGVILVMESSPALTVQDLKGRRLCLIDTSSTTGYVLPRAALRTAGLDPDRDVSTRLAGNHFQAIKDLSAGLCDAVGTYDKAYLAADRAGIPVATMRTLATTGVAPNDTICATASTTAEEQQAVREALLDFKPMRDIGKEVLGMLTQTSGYIPVDHHAYQRLREALQAAASPAP